MFQNSSSGQAPSLKYFLAEQKSILVVTFVGPITRENTGILEECLNQVLEKNSKWVILNFRDVPPTNDRAFFPILAKLKKALRERGSLIRITSMHPEYRKFLEQHGVVRSEEVFNNLTEALQTLPLVVSRVG